MEGTGFRDRIQEFESRNVQILGLSVDSVDENAAFADKYQLPFPLLSDTTREVCVAYGACDSTFDRAQRITYLIGPNGRVLQVYTDIDPAHHAEILLAEIDNAIDIEINTEVDNDAQPSQQVNTDLSGNENPSVRVCEQFNEEKETEMEDTAKEVEIQPQTIEPDEPEGVTEQAPALEMVGQMDPVPATREYSKVVRTASGVATMEKKSKRMPSVIPSQVQSPAQPGQTDSLVYALGEIGYDFGTEARQDAIVDAMGPDTNDNRKNPYVPQNLLDYLNDHPYEAAAVIWTLNVDATSIYAIQPAGPYANVAFDLLRDFLRMQLNKEIERVSIPGVVAGQLRLYSGQVVPVIIPEPRGMFCWTTQALIATVLDRKSEDESVRDKAESGLRNFLNRIYFEIRNLGLSPQERALNFAATNAFQVEQVFQTAAEEERVLDEITVERSPICRPDSDCWDVLLSFFDPENERRARTVSRFTVDVSDVVPVLVGEIRYWQAR